MKVLVSHVPYGHGYDNQFNRQTCTMNPFHIQDHLLHVCVCKCMCVHVCTHLCILHETEDSAVNNLLDNING